VAANGIVSLLIGNKHKPEVKREGGQI